MSKVKANWDDSSSEDEAPQKVKAPKTNWDDDSEEYSSEPEKVEEKKYTAMREKKKGLTVGKAEKLEKKRETRKKTLEFEDDGTDGFGGPLSAEEKARRQALVEKADFDNARELFGGPAEADEEVERGSPQVAWDPRSKEEFTEVAEDIETMLLPFQERTHYAYGVEQIVRKLADGLKEQDIKKLTTALNVIANEKKKAARPKKGAKKKAKPTMKMERRGQDFNEDDYDLGGDYDDFM